MVSLLTNRTQGKSRLIPKDFSSKWKRLVVLAVQPINIEIFFFVCLFVFLSTHSHVLFWGHWYPLFWISSDVSSGFQSQSGFCLIRIAEANVMYIP